MEQNMTALMLDDILKEQYLPAFRNQITTEPSPFFAQIKKEALTGEIIKAGAPMGLLGGYGAGKEGGPTPTAGRQKYQGFMSYAKDLYLELIISNKTLKLATSKGAILDAVHQEMVAAFNTASWHMGRQTYGDGTAKLANIVSVSGKTAIVDDTRNLIEGIAIDFYNEGATPDNDPVATARRIETIDRQTKTITFDGEALNDALNGGFITVQNSYGLEMDGLGTIFNEKIDKVYGIDKKERPNVNPVVVPCNNDITNQLLREGMRTSKNYKNGDVNMLLCSPTAFDAYCTNQEVSNVRIEGQIGDLAGGYKSIKYFFGNKEVDIVEDKFIPNGEIWGVNTNDFLLKWTDWEYVTKDGGAFNLMEGKSAFRALLSCYGNLVCENPGACVRYTGIA